MSNTEAGAAPIDMYEMMSTLRAVRRLRTDAIPEDVLERVLQAACWAPTGGNTQPWRVIVVRDAAKLTALQAIYAPEWATYSKDFMGNVAHMPEAEQAKWRRVLAAGDHLADHLHEAPAVLLFIANPKLMAITDSHLDRVSLVGGASVYPAVQNAMLACRAEGLGCALTTLHCLQEEAVIDLFDIPDGWATAAMIPIGYPVGGGHGPITRRPPSKMAYADTFGTPWPPPTKDL